MSQNNTTGLLKYLNEASQIVSGWPEWKKSGSDAARLHIDDKTPNHKHGIVIARKRK
ncbi:MULTISPECIES: hypothetical protein [Pantoea]|uniref:hypothetical protein n=1 Tax=Pantoea TaxID=53335 RepID=UPI001B313995|nr:MULTISPECIES: hypothetical protein [Pantoea]MDJ0089597.1 hypothetical protein [Pantoea allii]